MRYSTSSSWLRLTQIIITALLLQACVSENEGLHMKGKGPSQASGTPPGQASENKQPSDDNDASPTPDTKHATKRKSSPSPSTTPQSEAKAETKSTEAKELKYIAKIVQELNDNSVSNATKQQHLSVLRTCMRIFAKEPVVGLTLHDLLAYSSISHLRPTSQPIKQLMREHLGTWEAKIAGCTNAAKTPELLQGLHRTLSLMHKDVFTDVGSTQGNPHMLIELGERLLKKLFNSKERYTASTYRSHKYTILVLHQILRKIHEVAPDKLAPRDKNGLYQQFQEKIAQISKATDYYPYVYQGQLLQQSLARLADPSKPSAWEQAGKVYSGVKGAIKIGQGILGVVMLRFDFESIESGIFSIIEALEPLERGVKAMQDTQTAAANFTKWVSSIQGGDSTLWYDHLNGLFCLGLCVLEDPQNYANFSKAFDALKKRSGGVKPHKSMRRALRYGLIKQLGMLASRSSDAKVQQQSLQKLQALLENTRDWRMDKEDTVLMASILACLSEVAVSKTCTAKHQKQAKDLLEKWCNNPKAAKQAWSEKRSGVDALVGRSHPKCNVKDVCKAFLKDRKDLAEYLKLLAQNKQALAVPPQASTLFAQTIQEEQAQKAQIAKILAGLKHSKSDKERDARVDQALQTLVSRPAANPEEMDQRLEAIEAAIKDWRADNQGELESVVSDHADAVVLEIQETKAGLQSMLQMFGGRMNVMMASLITMNNKLDALGSIDAKAQLSIQDAKEKLTAVQQAWKKEIEGKQLRHKQALIAVVEQRQATLISKLEAIAKAQKGQLTLVEFQKSALEVHKHMRHLSGKLDRNWRGTQEVKASIERIEVKLAALYTKLIEQPEQKTVIMQQIRQVPGTCIQEDINSGQLLTSDAVNSVVANVPGLLFSLGSSNLSAQGIVSKELIMLNQAIVQGSVLKLSEEKSMLLSRYFPPIPKLLTTIHDASLKSAKLNAKIGMRFLNNGLKAEQSRNVDTARDYYERAKSKFEDAIDKLPAGPNPSDPFYRSLNAELKKIEAALNRLNNPPLAIKAPPSDKKHH